MYTKTFDRTAKLDPVQTKTRYEFEVEPYLDDNVNPWRDGRRIDWFATQDRQLDGLKDWYPTTDRENLKVVCLECADSQLEKTRLYGPYGNDVAQWLITASHHGVRVTFGRTHDGKEYVEF